tara:strand:- start:570 stop:1013 length:444 start_codon:yes stop_codon:yes gene_type:complete
MSTVKRFPTPLVKVLVPIHLLGLIILFSISTTAQPLKKSDLRGTYSKSTGVPAKWIHNDDGSSTEIMGMEYSRTTLYLKRFGRVKVVEEDKMLDLKIVHKGRWEVKGDTITITYNSYGEVVTEQYTFREPVYLELLGAPGGYTKELN